MGWEHYQTVDPPKKEPQVCRGLFGVRLLILHFKFQFSKSIKSSTFHIFLNLPYLLRENISIPKYSKITQKFTQNRKTLVNVLSGGIWRCLKRERDLGTKATLSDVKTMSFQVGSAAFSGHSLFPRGHGRNRGWTVAGNFIWECMSDWNSGIKLTCLEVIYQTRDTGFNRDIYSWKYDAQRSIFDEIRSVWITDETLSRMFDIPSQSKQKLRSKRRSTVAKIYGN